MNRLLEAAISRLTELTNISSGLSHPLDESRAKELFKALHKEGIRLDFGVIRAFALANAWPENYAKELAELGQKIGTGNRVIVKHPSGWGDQTVKELKTELKIS